MHNYEKVEEGIYCLREDYLARELIPLEEKIFLFNASVSGFLEKLRNKMKGMLVGIRKGMISEDSLEEMLSHITSDQFPFHYNRLQEWIQKKNEELCLVKKFLDEIKKKSQIRKKFLSFLQHVG